MAERDEGLTGAGAQAGAERGRERERAGERLAPVRERGPDEDAERRRRGRAAALEHDEHGVHVRHRMEDRAGDGTVDADIAGELREYRRDAVRAAPRRGREALAHLAL